MTNTDYNYLRTIFEDITGWHINPTKAGAPNDYYDHNTLTDAELLALINDIADNYYESSITDDDARRVLKGLRAYEEQKYSSGEPDNGIYYMLEDLFGEDTRDA